MNACISEAFGKDILVVSADPSANTGREGAAEILADVMSSAI